MIRQMGCRTGMVRQPLSGAAYILHNVFASPVGTPEKHKIHQRRTGMPVAPETFKKARRE